MLEAIGRPVTITFSRDSTAASRQPSSSRSNNQPASASLLSDRQKVLHSTAQHSTAQSCRFLLLYVCFLYLLLNVDLHLHLYLSIHFDDVIFLMTIKMIFLVIVIILFVWTLMTIKWMTFFFFSLFLDRMRGGQRWRMLRGQESSSGTKRWPLEAGGERLVGGMY